MSSNRHPRCKYLRVSCPILCQHDATFQVGEVEDYDGNDYHHHNYNEIKRVVSKFS